MPESLRQLLWEEEYITLLYINSWRIAKIYKALKTHIHEKNVSNQFPFIFTIWANYNTVIRGEISSYLEG